MIRVLFNRIFNELKEKYPDWKDKEPENVQAAYFAQRRDKRGNIILEDSKTGEAQKDEEAYNLIMKDKERLLSFAEPVSFIFSHSALREGWDNPNVFQICTMNQTSSEIKKRQEVGRGVRLSLDQTGERIKDERINILTVVANESYEKYVSQLQSEIAMEYQQEIEERYGKSIADLTDEERSQIAEEYGEGILPPRPKNARKRSVAKLRKEYTLKPEFKELWEKIKHKTRYTVKIDTSKLVKEVVGELNKAEIRTPRVAITKARVDVSAENAFEALQISASKTVIDLAGRYPLPNLVDVMSNLMEHTNPPVYLTRKTLLEIIKNLSGKCKKAAMDNPNEFATEAVNTTKEKLADQLVEGIQYEKINKWYEMKQLEVDIPGWEEYFVPAEKSVYDQVICDSNVERKFVEGLEKRDDVKMYIKLPSWFVLQTPIGTYNPDWAIVMEDRDEHGEPTDKPLLYLVRETKGTTDLSQLHRPDERLKVKCGERHFQDTLNVSYKVVTSAQDLP
jgi:type III restriction enzyme